jgi:hypothetical protein
MEKVIASVVMVGFADFRWIQSPAHHPSVPAAKSLNNVFMSYAPFAHLMLSGSGWV